MMMRLSLLATEMQLKSKHLTYYHSMKYFSYLKGPKIECVARCTFSLCGPITAEQSWNQRLVILGLHTKTAWLVLIPE